MTFRPSTETAERSGCFGSSENTASHGRCRSSFQCTASTVAVESTVTGPGFTPDRSAGMVCAGMTAAANPDSSDKLRRSLMESRLRLYTGQWLVGTGLA